MGQLTAFRSLAIRVLTPFLDQLVRLPTPDEIEAVAPFCADPTDAPIFASAILAAPDIVLANDFDSFHTPSAKTLWAQHGMTVESLYGLLCVFGKRERKGEARDVE